MTRRQQPARWFFLLAAVPLVLFALIGAAYGGFLPYALLATVCICQFFYPTLLGWGVVLLVAVAGLVSYGYAAVMDIVRLANGASPSIFLNTTDTFAFVLLIGVIATVAVGLIMNRPRAMKPSDA